MPIYEQSPVRIELSPLINPPRGLMNIGTTDQPQLWRANPVAIQLGIFDNLNQAVDLSNLIGLQMIVTSSPQSQVLLIAKTILQDDLFDTITRQGWLEGTEQQAQFDLSAAELDLGLEAQERREFWCAFIGTTTDNRQIVYGAGWIQVFNPSNQLPPPMPGIVSLHEQINDSGNSLVVPSSLVHTEEVTITGAASVRNIVIQTSGLVSGALLKLLAIFDAQATNGTQVNLYANAVAGAPIFTFTRDGDEPNALFELTANGVGGFKKIKATVPAY